jgi:hypothetical protein
MASFHAPSARAACPAVRSSTDGEDGTGRDYIDAHVAPQRGIMGGIRTTEVTKTSALK